MKHVNVSEMKQRSRFVGGILFFLFFLICVLV